MNSREAFCAVDPQPDLHPARFSIRIPNLGNDRGERHRRSTQSDDSRTSPDVTPGLSASELTRQYLQSPIRQSLPGLCYAPFDIRLGDSTEKDEDILTVVQPDISVICDPVRLDEKGCLGAPDLIVEILSPATSRRDWKDKFSLYEEFGVREYWIVDPAAKTVVVFILGNDGRYGRPEVYTEEDSLPVGLLEGLVIELGPVFKRSAPVQPIPARPGQKSASIDPLGFPDRRPSGSNPVA